MQGILALFIRSLRDQVRGTSFAWMRGGLALVVLITLMFFEKWFNRSGTAPGMVFFGLFAGYNAVMIAIAALSYFASSITEEKEEQTLGLLRMTDLSVLAMLFGKSTSRMMGGLFMLLVQLPFALLAVTLGGMAWEQVLVVYALLCSFLFFAANLGLLASVFAKSSGIAGLITAIAGCLYFGSGELLDEASDIAGEFHFRTLSEQLSDAAEFADRHCGLEAFEESISINWPSAPWRHEVLAFLVSGAACFVLAWASFERFARDEVSVGRRVSILGRLAWLRGRAGRTWKDGVVWKDFHFVHFGWRGFWIKTAIYLICAVWLYLEEFAGRTWGRNGLEEYGWAVFGFSLFVIIVETAFGASRIFRLEQRWQTLDGLFLLPQDLSALARSKRNALILSLVPAGFFCSLSLVCGMPQLLNAMFHSGETFLGFFQTMIILPLEFVLHYRLIIWFSMRLRWGGLAAALITSFFAHLISVTFLVIGAESAAGIPMIIILVVVNKVLGARNEKRIEEAASVG